MTDAAGPVGSTPDAAVEAQPEPRSRSSLSLPSVHFPTLAVAVSVTAFFWVQAQNNHSALTARLDALSSRLEGIPTKQEMGAEIEQVAEIQRSTWDANATRVEASAREMDATAEGIRAQIASMEANNRQITSMLNERVNALDTRIANIGVDYSGAIIEYFRTGRAGAVVSGDGTGGPDGADEVYRDYAIRLVVRDTDMDLDDAISFVDRAFVNMRGPEANRISELARAARARNRGVANE